MLEIPACDASLSFVPEAKVVLGEPGTGKTRRLARHVRALLDSACDLQDIIVFAATLDGCRQADLTALAEAGVRVTTPRAYALGLLATPEGAAFSGRTARLLSPVEMRFLMEDLKVSGLRAGRLRGLADFLMRGLSEMADCEDGWLVNDEERGVLDLMRQAAAFMGGIAEPELSGLAVRFLRSGKAPAGSGFAHVAVDDYQLLSRASQVLVTEAARASACVSADEHACFEAFESYPNAMGVQEFVDANPHAEIEVLSTCHRSAATLAAVHAVRTEAGIECLGTVPADDAPAGTTVVSVRESVESEVGDAVVQVTAALEGGVEPSRIVVACESAPIRREITHALDSAGIPVEAAVDGRLLGCDVRDGERSRPARMAAALSLAADPLDGPAWRSWCGFGDPLGASDGIAELRSRFAGCALPAALAALAAEADGGAQVTPALARLVDAYRRGSQMVEDARGLAGNELVNALAAHCGAETSETPGHLWALLRPGVGAEEMAPLVPIDDASRLARLLHERIDFPSFGRPGCVRVCGMARMAAQEADVVLLVGFANGIFPKSDYFDREKMAQDAADRQHLRDAALFSCAVGRAWKVVEASSFAEAGLEAADRLGARIDRIRLRDGRRVARTSPSIFLTCL